MQKYPRINFNSIRGLQTLTLGATAVFAALGAGTETHGLLLTALGNCYVLIGKQGGATVASASQTVANPGVFTTATQAFTAGTAVTLSPAAPGGALPGGFAANTVYYVIAGGLTTTACELSATPGGAGIQVTSSAACVLQVQTPATAANGFLIKASDPPLHIGCAPGEVLSMIQQGAATGTLQVAELT